MLFPAWSRCFHQSHRQERGKGQRFLLCLLFLNHQLKIITPKGSFRMAKFGPFHPLLPPPLTASPFLFLIIINIIIILLLLSPSPVCSVSITKSLLILELDSSNEHDSFNLIYILAFWLFVYHQPL